MKLIYRKVSDNEQGGIITWNDGTQTFLDKEQYDELRAKETTMDDDMKEFATSLIDMCSDLTGCTDCESTEMCEKYSQWLKNA